MMQAWSGGVTVKAPRSACQQVRWVLKLQRHCAERDEDAWLWGVLGLLVHCPSQGMEERLRLGWTVRCVRCNRR